jgi:hypothetical protein
MKIVKTLHSLVLPKPEALSSPPKGYIDNDNVGLQTVPSLTLSISWTSDRSFLQCKLYTCIYILQVER